MEAQTLVCGEVLGAHPCGKTIRDARLNPSIYTRAFQRHVMPAIERNVERLESRMFFLGIKPYAYAAGRPRKPPRETSVVPARFKATVPKNRTIRASGRFGAGKTQRIIPNTLGVFDAALLHEVFGERNGLPKS